jgi:glycosyltransferase involved in cell wall biosynthesis
MTILTWPNKLSNVLFIVPAYNEEGAILKVIDEIKQSGLGDILVINDGSKDHTQEVATQAGALVLKMPYNLGIGGAVQAGLKYAVETGYDYIARLDGDGQHRVDEVEKLLAFVQAKKADIVIGSRFFPGQHTYTPPTSRALGIKWFGLLVTWLTRTPSYDTTSGMQAMNRQACIVLAENYPQDYPEVEARILLHKAKLKVIEVPAKMAPRATGLSSITYLRAIYYAFKVTLATILAAMREAPR